MRVRTPFAAAFGILLLGSAYLGFGADANPTPVNDKALHLVAFFALTLTGYWVVETSRRTLMKIVPLAALAVDIGSEFAQAIINPNREFDPADIGANLLGSFAAIALCAWYHKRMLERKRRKKMQGYGLVTSDDVADIELGEGPHNTQETGVVGEDEDEDDEGADAWDNMDDGNSPNEHTETEENGKKPAE